MIWEYGEYERGCKAGFDGKPFDYTRSIYWRRGWTTGNAERGEQKLESEPVKTKKGKVKHER